MANDPVAAPPAVSEFSFRDKLAAMAHGIEHAANAIYHDVMTVESTVTNWVVDNPEVQPIINGGLALAKAAIERTGFPVDAVEIVGVDLIAALRGLAAADNSVASVTVKGSVS